MTGARHHLTGAQRQRAAQEEFARWREQHPDFTSQDLISAWRAIRQSWRLMEMEPRRKTR